MVDYKQKMIEAKKILDNRLKRENLTKKNAIQSAVKFYEYNKEMFIDKVLDHFIYRMERFNETSIVYDRKTEWHERENIEFNEKFERMLLALIEVGLKKASPDFCEYTVSIEKRPIWNMPSVKEKYLVIVMSIKE